MAEKKNKFEKEVPNDLKQISMELQYYEQQAKQLQSQLQNAQSIFEETDGVLKSLKALSEVKSTTFQALGSGVLIKINVAEAKTVLVDVGAGVLLEKAAPDAESILNEKMKSLEKATKEIQDALMEIVKRAEVLQMKAEELNALEQKRKTLFGKTA